MEKLSHAPLSVETEPIERGPIERGPIVPLADHRAFAMRVKRSVRRHTAGGVKVLEVQVDHETIRLGGRCISFYCKQLAQQAAMRIRGNRQVVNAIEVEAD